MRKEYDFAKAKRGPAVRIAKGKTRITIRLDDDMIAWFKRQVHKAGGGNYQSLINAALRDHTGRSDEPLEATLRRVLGKSFEAQADDPRRRHRSGIDRCVNRNLIGGGFL